MRIVPSRKVSKTLDPHHIGHIVLNNTRCRGRVGTSGERSTDETRRGLKVTLAIKGDNTAAAI